MTFNMEFEMGYLVFAATVFIFATFAFMALFWPVWGNLYRYRAHYRPQRMNLDDLEADSPLASSFTDDSVRGYWSMFAKVKRVEGVKGWWKGFGAMVLATVFPLFVILFLPFIALGVRALTGRQSITLLTVLIFTVLYYLLGIVLRVFLIRAITWTREDCNLFCNPFRSFRLLFNSAERKNPLKVCGIPGMLAASLMTDAGYACILGLRWVMISRKMDQRPPTTLEVFLSLFMDVAIALAVSPWEMMSVRIASQEMPQEAPQELPAPVSATGDVDPPQYVQNPQAEVGSGPNPVLGVELREEVITLRSQLGFAPYRGLIDCATRITVEEGWMTLWRGWAVSAVFFIFADPVLRPAMGWNY